MARLCYKARVPVSQSLLNALEFHRKEPFTTAAVCVYPARINDAVSVIQKMGVSSYLPVAAGRFTMKIWHPVFWSTKIVDQCDIYDGLQFQ